MLFLYNEVIYRPILNLLIFLYNTVAAHDIGFAIIFVTIAIRLILAPFLHRSLKQQKAMNALQPKLNELRETHKDNKEAQAKAMMDLYKEHKVNPLSSCLPMLVQLPVLIALYQVLIKALNGNLAGLYNFVANPGTINPKFLGIVDLSHPDIVFALVAGLLQYVQTRMMMPKTANQDPTAKALNLQALYLFPVITVIFAWRLPSGLPLYWIVNTLFAVGQQWLIMRKKPEATAIVTK
jgi:YidC/Oxa1 family membrane protein insertase